MVAGPILNILGPRWTTVFAMTGYPLYIGLSTARSPISGLVLYTHSLSHLTGSFWYYDSTGKSWFPILGGAYLGLTAGLLWTTASEYMFRTFCLLVNLIEVIIQVSSAILIPKKKTKARGEGSNGLSI
jgi:hypothetical protein